MGTGRRRRWGQCQDAPAVDAATGRRRIAETMTMTTPTPISTSPRLKTFAQGSQGGRAKMSVSGASAGSGTKELFEYTVLGALPRTAIAPAEVGM